LVRYLSGAKRYTASAEFGFETNTLDMDEKGNVTKTAPYDHITMDAIEKILPQFHGEIMQVPPIFSALKKGGKKLYEKAREGVAEEDMKIEARPVVIHKCELINKDKTTIPCFDLEIECGGGTYIRSLIRDIAYKLDSCATMTRLERTQQGQFDLHSSLPKSEWSPDSIYAAIDDFNAARENAADDEDELT
jgi:tRNA pseudouridine55 synthase